MHRPLKMLRYNTGTDKKAFIRYRNRFDAVVFNATIVAYSGSSLADLVSIYAQKYIIDPQTHIFQQDIGAITSDKSNPDSPIKKSVAKYFRELPTSYTDIIINQKRPLSPEEIQSDIDSLVECIYEFETSYVSNYLDKKEYSKYLKYANVTPIPKMVVAPYFMMKKGFTDEECARWMELNREALSKTIEYDKRNKLPIAAQLVMDKHFLLNEKLSQLIDQTYSQAGYDYIFIWVDDYNGFTVGEEYAIAFAKLIKQLNELGKKPMMAYGGYDAIILCAEDSPYKLYGVSQSVGYGEYRSVTPVGGGLPINKYYFPPIHKRLSFNDAAHILNEQGFFDDNNSLKERTNRYYHEICGCHICKKLIKDDINNFEAYNDSTPFRISSKNGYVMRMRPTSDALYNAALHFLDCKSQEWDSVINESFTVLTDQLLTAYNQYLPGTSSKINRWVKIYEA